MVVKHACIERPGGDRLTLYAELGRYFSADGHFNEPKFRTFLRRSIESGGASSPSPEGHGDEQGKWLSAYLTKVMDYLEEKGMQGESSALLKAAIDEAADLGINEISVSAAHMKRLLQDIPVTSRRSEHRHSPDEKKKRIYHAALTAFSEEGYHQATMERIASLSGVAKGTVYTYFKSKEELLDQLLEEHYQDIIRKINEICSKDGDVLQQMRELIEYWVTFIEENPLLYRLIQSEAIFQRSGGKAMFYDYIARHLPMLKERIVALNRADRLKTMNFYTAFYGTLGFIDGVAQKWFRCHMGHSLRDEIPTIIEVLFNGFSGKDAQSPPQRTRKDTRG